MWYNNEQNNPYCSVMYYGIINAFKIVLTRSDISKLESTCFMGTPY